MVNPWHFVAWPGEEPSRGELSLSRGRPFGDDVWMDQTVKKLELEQTVRGEGEDHYGKEGAKFEKPLAASPSDFLVRAETNTGKKVQRAKTTSCVPFGFPQAPLSTCGLRLSKTRRRSHFPFYPSPANTNRP